MKTVNELPICVSEGLYTLFKKLFLLFRTALLKCFIYSRVGILDSSYISQQFPLPLNLFTIYPKKM